MATLLTEKPVNTTPESPNIAMDNFTLIERDNHEAVLFINDRATGLKGFIGLHNTVLGPGLGGCRMMHYPNEQAALTDALNLSRAMTYKNALAGLPYGGGKAVVMLPNAAAKTPELVDALARRIHLLGGSYFTAGDIGSNAADMKRMKDMTPYVSGLSPADGGLGDSSILTGLGVFMGIKAAVKHRLGTENMAGLRVAVQGTGKVGYYLMEHLIKAGCQVLATDMNPEALQRAKEAYPSIEIVAPEAIFEQDVDVLSPNAVGGTLTEAIAMQTNASIVAGGANNPLATSAVGALLAQRNILFAPDFAINAGGVIVLSFELAKGTIAQAQSKTEAIYDTALAVFQKADQEGLLPLDAAVALATQRIEAKRKG
jgi:glutamate dehydrogenase/leucine dehydrogenase